LSGYNYGANNYGALNYGGVAAGISELIGKTGIVIEVYDNTGAFKGLYQSGVGELIAIEFSHDVSGPRDFILSFAGYVEIDKKDLIKIKIFNSDNYFFMGVVRRIPIEGSTETAYNYSGYGLNDYLIRANTESRSYANKTVSFIIEDLLDNVITAKTPITKDASKLETISTTVTAIEFNYISCQDALKQLKELAQSDGNEYLIGVDSDGDFFSKQRSTDVQATLVVGKEGRYGIERYAPDDSIEEKTKLYVLDKDGSYVTSVSSTIDNDIFEQKITAPDINNADISNWAQGVLTEKEITTRKASITWKLPTIEPEYIIADGTLRIISNVPPNLAKSQGFTAWGAGTWGSGLWGGGKYQGFDLDDTLRILEIKYIINAQAIVREIQLGGRAVDLENLVVDVNKNVNDLRVSLGR
jgi:hypothetical protein